MIPLYPHAPRISKYLLLCSSKSFQRLSNCLRRLPYWAAHGLWPRGHHSRRRRSTKRRAATSLTLGQPSRRNVGACNRAPYYPFQSLKSRPSLPTSSCCKYRRHLQFWRRYTAPSCPTSPPRVSCRHATATRARNA